MTALRVSAILLLLLTTAGCGNQVESTFADLSSELSSTTPPASVSTSAAPTPSATATSTSDFVPATIVKVVLDGLAVRRGPGTAYQQLDAARVTAEGVEVLGIPYWLMAGEELYIQAGPLRIDGTAWYSVHYLSDLIWVVPGGTDPNVEGWVAAGAGGAAYLEVSRVPDEFCCVYASGVGSGVTPPLPRVPICPESYSCVVAWVAGQADPDGTCDLRMTIQTTGALVVEESIRGFTHGALLWTEEGAAIVVDSDCSWSLEVTYFANP